MPSPLNHVTGSGQLMLQLSDDQAAITEDVHGLAATFSGAVVPARTAHPHQRPGRVPRAVRGEELGRGYLHGRRSTVLRPVGVRPDGLRTGDPGECRNNAGSAPAPPTTTSWADHLYTCTYHLPAGPLVLSVKESPDLTSANAYLHALRQRLGHTHPLLGLLGLGDTAYDTPDGTVVVLKDDKTLQVNATGLPRKAVRQHQSRADRAHEVASEFLGCWTGK